MASFARPRPAEFPIPLVLSYSVQGEPAEETVPALRAIVLRKADITGLKQCRVYTVHQTEESEPCNVRFSHEEGVTARFTYTSRAFGHDADTFVLTPTACYIARNRYANDLDPEECTEVMVYDNDEKRAIGTLVVHPAGPVTTEAVKSRLAHELMNG